MNCSVFKDLIPNYMKGLTSRETNEEIRKHMDDCKDCRSAYEKMLAADIHEMPKGSQRPGSTQKTREGKLPKNVIPAVLSSVAVLTALVIFGKFYYVPIPFDADYMSAEVYKAAPVASEDGSYISLRSVDQFQDMIPENQGDVIDAVQTVYHGINYISSDMIHRTINRDGGKVKVYYYCYKESLWDLLFADPSLKRGGEYRPLNGNGFDKGDFEPQMREIYYLPDKNLDRYENLPDQEYDRLRETGTLVWSGIS